MFLPSSIWVKMGDCFVIASEGVLPSADATNV
jgi:hypothetical protein